MPSPSAPGAFVAARLAAGRLGATFRHLDETGSTNTDLTEEARAGVTGSAVLVTDHQTAGRGRMNRVWTDTDGGQLLVSFRLPLGAGPAAAVGAAIAAGAQQTLEAAGMAARVKWPNDLGVVRPDGGFAKLAGLLSEYVDGPVPVVIVGMGLNVLDAPVPGSTCVASEGVALDRDDILAGVLTRLPMLLSDPVRVREVIVSRSATIGSRVRVERIDDAIEGMAIDLDEAGHLLVRDGERVHVVAVGDVVHLRSTGS